MPPKSKRQAKGDSGSAQKKAKCPFSAGEYRKGRTDGPLKCKWAPAGSTDKSPHDHQPLFRRPKICNSALDNIGNTPLIRINKIAAEEGLQCELLAKCEFFNAGGSVKDRIGKRMVEDAEKSGRIKPGDTLIEPTSGNTGIGIALAAAVKGYRCIITLPEKMSQEKVDVLKGLGAEIIRTPTEAAFDSPESHIGVAKKLNKELPNSHILDQYANPGNPLAHYDQTAEEILEQCDGKVDMLVVSAGTGGTLTGIARKLKERCPNIEVVAVDPIGSILAEPDSLNDKDRLKGYQVEGIGYDFIPTVLDRALVDQWVKSNDRDSFIMSRRLIRSEGLLCGGSCGSAMWAATVAAKKLKKGQRCVVILPDSTRNYMTKFLNNDWMADNDFVDDKVIQMEATVQAWWSDKLVQNLPINTPYTISPQDTCQDAINVLKEQGFDVLPVVDTTNACVGVVTDGNLTAKLTSGRLQVTDAVEKAMFKNHKKVSLSTTLGELSRIFDRHHYALVFSEQRCYSEGKFQMRSMVFGVVTRIDLLSYITKLGSVTPREGSPAEGCPMNKGK